MQPNDAYQQRRERIYSRLREENIDVAVLQDTEGRRDRSIRYLTGMPSDAVLFLFAEGSALLVPWDVPLAEELASVEQIVPYTDFKRTLPTAVETVLRRRHLLSGSIELTSALPYPLYRQIRESVNGELLCRDGGITAFISDLRAVKDRSEQQAYAKAAEITNTLLAHIEDELRNGAFNTELELAFFIEMEARRLGAEGTGFETLVANPSRSYSIHPFPAFTAAPLNTPGPSILDFGITVDGYTSDVTVTILRGKPTAEQQDMVDTIKESWDLIFGLIKPGASTFELADGVARLMKERGYDTVHALGHGIGLDAHEAPYLRNRQETDSDLTPGMVVAVEPGVYKKGIGGVRLENDILITETGTETLTTSRILYLPETG